ncbi:hypothetical protein [Sphaerotilus microaerophilus]|uniref:CHAT domain-containing protein n=1 Tax=Sphaerotilus microaerophilus TaxID=2914710 RepID=A0ABN6PJD6_9BURK|nr:hypothetical protein [Sphaerotilus sp. FB-5]BDI05174.1 hypothetical protein CATMQ487_21440 [Sphaerotilus sp. FB-5]
MSSNWTYRRTIYLRFQKVGDELVLIQLAGPGGYSQDDVARYRVADMEAFQHSLAHRLEAYQRSPGADTLEALAREGHRAYKSFLRGFEVDGAKRWWRDVVAKHNSVAPPILEITVIDVLTIPFGLYYFADPDNVENWRDYSSVVDGFIGVHFPLNKLYRRRARLPHSIQELCEASESPRILHSIDTRLHTVKREMDNWAQLKGSVNSPPTKKEVVKGWVDNDSTPHLVHCSCHLGQDETGLKYLTCGRKDKIYVEDLDDVRLEYPPFVFLNACGGGAIAAGDRDNLGLTQGHFS